MLCRLVKRLKVNNHDRDDDSHHQVSCTFSDDAALLTRDHLENCLATLATVPKTEELEVPTKKANTMLNARTLFPKLVLPDLELTDSSSESDDDDKREELYRTKEDQDVAVFMILSKRMSIQSLLHILRGQAVSQHLPTQYSQPGLPKPPARLTITPKPVAKKLRFAEVNHQVRVVIHEVESWKNMKGLWLSQDEMIAIRTEVIDAVKFFRNHRPEYKRSLAILALNEEPKSVIENHTKLLTEEWYARGLESHILDLLSENRKATVEAVLQEQCECQQSGDSYDIMAHCLREQSVAYSRQSYDFAIKIALSDQISALKATMLRWDRPLPADAANNTVDRVSLTVWNTETLRGGRLCKRAA